ncbi:MULTISPECIES: bifunctional alpha/beta hydrolase/OsmC family protein [Variovorax]|uniref:bifunctional alpha/beta hydrolase/OsmC family protein n=1 Tax=Variovorax TaxID=34072 RepID=UPI000783943A|nr:bifunctional alpha/beta hydrolase/OsmC family protein [Variovorax paradoxus]MBW8715722.1 OsmC family protein [Variovorax paradoxus]MBW8891723.1 OsmC family protein [Burkholderiales bacterium]
MPTRPFEFLNRNGHRLSGSLEMPEGIPRGWALFAHCFTCGKNNLAAVRIARTLASVGIGVLRFDFTGLGGSEGNFADASFSLNVQDLVSAASAMEAAGMPPRLLIGHSLGGSAMLAAADRIAGAHAIATIAAPFDVAQVLHLLDPAGLARLQTEGQALVQVIGRPMAVGKAFVDDLRTHDPGARIAALHRPLLLLHAPQDHTVDIENATRIFLAARHPKSFVSLDDADHLLSKREDAEQVARLIATWADRYLPEPPAGRPVAADAEAEETGLGKFQLALRSGGSRWLADEPETVGGLGSGPTPYNLLSSALAACTTMTLRHYADSKGWPVTRIRTAVNHCKDKAISPPDVFSRRVSIDGAITEAQRTQLLDMAQRCPVHRTLEGGARFEPVEGEPPA